MNSIFIIIVFFGRWPDYLGYFLQSCASNKSFQWLIFSDNRENPVQVENVKYYLMDIEEFGELASEKLGFPVSLNSPYKLCDFKPSYGKIFRNYLSGCEFWGYCDIDMIFGKLDGFITKEFLESTDIVSSYPGFLSGPFCLYRNTEKINNLFIGCPDHKTILSDEKHHAFDENVPRNENQSLTLKKFFYFIWYLFIQLLALKDIRDLRYQFQWYYKHQTLGDKNPVDMTEVVWQAGRIKSIRHSFMPWLVTDPIFKRLGITSWRLKWEDGVLYNRANGEEIFGLHLQNSKNSPEFTTSKWKPEVLSFQISRYGIFYE